MAIPGLITWDQRLGGHGVEEGQFNEPKGVAVSAEGNIIVADTKNHRIQIFDNNGEFLLQFGKIGSNDGELMFPYRLAVMRDKGDIVVMERAPTHQIQIYTQQGEFVRKFGANLLYHPRAVTVDPSNKILVADRKKLQVFIFSQLGALESQFGVPSITDFNNGIAVNNNNEILMCDFGANCVKVFNYSGEYLRQISGGSVKYPIGVSLTSKNEILIVGNHEDLSLNLFTEDGSHASSYQSMLNHDRCCDAARVDDCFVLVATNDCWVLKYRFRYLPNQVDTAAVPAQE